MTNSETLLDVAAAALRRARSQGADAADVDVAEGRSLSVTSRLGAMEDVNRAEGRDLSLRVFVGKASAVVSTNDFSQDTLDALAARAVAMARLAPEDPHAGLAPPDLLARDVPDLDLYDETGPDVDGLFAAALEAEDAARAVDGVTNSLGAGAGASHRSAVLATSAGFAGGYRASRFSLSAGAVAGSGTGMENDYAFTSARYRDELEAAHKVGHEAGTRAVRALQPGRPETFQGPVVFEPRVARGLLGHLASAVNGRAVARGATFLGSRMGRRIFAEGINVFDDPLRPRGPASRPFDGEGLPSVRRAIVQDGRLQSWILDLASARQLGLAPTGQAARGGGSPSPSTANLYLEPGTDEPETLISSVKLGVFVTGMIGMGVSVVTGDYSRGANGFLIENGEITRPVSGFTIAGNLEEMFTRLTPADDLVLRYGTDAPTLMVEGLTVAGG